MEPLFTTETAYTFEEFKKFNYKVMQKSVILIYSMLAAIVILVIGKSFFIDWSYIDTALIVAVIFIAAYFPFSLNKKLKDTYNSNKVMTKTVARFDFFEDGFSEITENATGNFKYADLNKIIETQTNFYLMLAKNAGAIIVKENCSEELIEFIRNLKKQK
jgi:hypothetical protein